MGQFRAADLFRRKPVGRVIAEGGEHLPDDAWTVRSACSS